MGWLHVQESQAPSGLFSATPSGLPSSTQSSLIPLPALLTLHWPIQDMASDLTTREAEQAVFGWMAMCPA